MLDAALAEILSDLGQVAVAVSGGVDSMTLAATAQRTLGPDRVTMVHAASPAVPQEATLRVRDQARRDGWTLIVIDAGEFADPRYIGNPVNRCFFCKTNLYGTIRRETDRPIVSGANLDDLAEYRPGLDAARDHGVRHPYIEAGFDKAAVRGLARRLGLDGVAELPASPCLASRVETGIAIDASALSMIHAIETLVRRMLKPAVVRCRIRASGMAIELDPPSLKALSPAAEDDLRSRIADLAGDMSGRTLAFAPYRAGSAFLAAAR